MPNCSECLKYASRLCASESCTSGCSDSAAVAGYTVLYRGAKPWRAVAILELPDARRTVAYSEEPQVISLMLNQECCAREFQLEDGRFSIHP